MSFFGFGQSVEVEILLNDAESRKRAEHKTEDGKKEKYFLFYDGETVSGKVSLALKNPNKRLEHQGIKIEFIGQIGEWAPRASLPGRLRRAREPTWGWGRGVVPGPAPVRPFGAPCPVQSEARRPATSLRCRLPCQSDSASRGWWGWPRAKGSIPAHSLIVVGTLPWDTLVVPSACAQLCFLPPGFPSEMHLPSLQVGLLGGDLSAVLLLPLSGHPQLSGPS